MTELAEQTFSTGELAAAAGVHAQTIIKWAKEGLLKPSGGRRQKYHPRRYTLHDRVAARVARASLQIGLPRPAVAEMVRMIQRPDESEMKRALVVTLHSETPGLMRHLWIRDMNDDSAQDVRVIRAARREKRVISEASLYEIVGGALKQEAERRQKAALQSTNAEGE